MAEKHNGFASYLENHEFTSEFINDYKYWCKRIYYQWKKLATDFDTFYEHCWEALLTKINDFNPEIATIQTFCISRINNEAWRFYMKYQTRKIEIDTDNEVIQNTLTLPEYDEWKDDLYDFQLYCNKMGVKVNLKELYEDYTEQKESAPMIAYAWWKAKNKEVVGRDDISKTRRRTVNQHSHKE